ncbi:MAG: hypothetical protein ACM31C_02495 [Acidobacteriota bacterium]
MLRQVVLACLLAATASAAPGKRALHLEPEDEHSAHHLFAAEHAGDFPSVSDDGSTIAELYREGEDFTGAPITTLVLWSKTGTRLASFRLGGFTDPSRPPEHAGKIAAYEWPILAAANAQLSHHLWSSLAVGKPCGEDPVDPGGALCFADGLSIRYLEGSDELVIRAGKRAPRRVAAAFPPAGRRDAADGGGGCGGTRGLAGGYGSLALGIVILDPASLLGGDSCVGLPASDRALPVLLLSGTR